MELVPIRIDPELVSACGLYCGSCRSYLKGRCPGCAKNEKASWCKVRTCNLERGSSTCAQCTEHLDPSSCRKFSNPIASVFGFVFNTDRAAGIRMIREQGLEDYVGRMAEQRRLAPRRRG